MSQADLEPITPDTFAAFATWLGTPLPDDPIRAIRILRREAAAEIERLITMLDALGGGPDLEANGDAEPTLGWPAVGRIFGAGSNEDGELEPSLGWTGIVNQTSRNRLGEGGDFERDDADREPSLGSQACNPALMMPGRDRTGDQSWWGAIGGRDREDEHDGCEPVHDNEGTERIPSGGP